MTISRLHNTNGAVENGLERSRAIGTRATTIAVTGIRTAVGRGLMAALDADPSVEAILCFDIVGPQTPCQKAKVVAVDLTRGDCVEVMARHLEEHRVRALVHLAFRDSPTLSPGASHELESLGTMRVVQACLEGGVRKVVSWSRSWLYGARADAPALLDESQPLRARRTDRFFADKMDAERDVLSFGAPGRARIATLLRTAPLIDPHSPGMIFHLLRDTRIPSIAGFNPMWQCVHVEDAVSAFVQALRLDVPGAINVVSPGVLPLGEARRLAGHRGLKLPRSLATALVGGLWLSGSCHVPPSLLDYLQFPCVADGGRAERLLQLTCKHSTSSTLTEAAQCHGAPASSPAHP